jgi:hypothetical protein
MRTDFYTKTILTVIACLLVILVLRPLLTPQLAEAQGGADFYIEPGFTAIRKPDGTAQVPAKLVINRTTGDIWGFPTLQDSPYPINTTASEAPVIKPIYLGKFDFSKARP